MSSYVADRSSMTGDLMTVDPVLSRAGRHALMSTKSNREEAGRPSVRRGSETRDGDMEKRSAWGENAERLSNGRH